MRKILIVLGTVLLSLSGFAKTHFPADTSFQQYTGKYKFPEGSVVTEVNVVLEGDALQITSVLGSSPLEKREEDLFAIIEFDGTARFNRDNNRKVVGVTINAMGYVLEGTRTESGFVWLIRKDTSGPSKAPSI